MQTKQYQLPKEFATKWVEALRENKVPQNVGIFKSKNEYGKDGYCATGLAYYANGFSFVPNESRVEVDGKKLSLWNTFQELPMDGCLVNSIVILNDDKRMNFPEIADWVEQNVEFI